MRLSRDPYVSHFLVVGVAALLQADIFQKNDKFTLKESHIRTQGTCIRMWNVRYAHGEHTLRALHRERSLAERQRLRWRQAKNNKHAAATL